MSEKSRARHRNEMRRGAYVAGIAQSALEAARLHAVRCTPESARLANETALSLFSAIYRARDIPRAYVDEDLERLRNQELDVALQSVANHTTHARRGG